MKHYKLRFTIGLWLGALLFIACNTPGNTVTTNGEISEVSMLGQMSFDFAGSLEGISFELKEQPGKVYNLHVQSFDEAIKFGIMSKDSQGVLKFEDVVGWKVKIVHEKDEEDDGGYRVISFKRINNP